MRSLIPDISSRMGLSSLPFRIVLSACLFLGGAAIASGQQPTDTPSSTAISSSTANAKAKKVWTNDDVAAASPGVTVAAKAAASPTPSATGANANLAVQLRGKLEKLQPRLEGRGHTTR